MLWMLLACAGLPDATLILEPDASRAGIAGASGPHGAGLLELRIAARVTDVMPLNIVFPATDTVELAVTDAPTAVLIHGGFVEPERYHWLAAHLASRGWLVALPRADSLLAITEPGNGALALETVHDLSRGPGLLSNAAHEDGPTLTMGHSLGGVMAARQFAEDPAITGLVLLASVPAPNDPIEQAPAGPVLALLGDNDHGLRPDEVGDALDRFDGTTSLWMVEGMNHYGWTDHPSDLELARDGELRRALHAVRRDALRVLDGWLTGEVLLHDTSFTGPFPGVEEVP